MKINDARRSPEYDNRSRTNFARLKLDPEDLRMNAKRARWARKTLQYFQSLVGTDDGDAMADLLQYLMHLSDRSFEYGDFDEALECAAGHYDRFTDRQPSR